VGPFFTMHNKGGPELLLRKIRHYATLSSEDRKTARTAAKTKGIVKGRSVEMYGHLKLDCKEAPARVRDFARTKLSIDCPETGPSSGNRSVAEANISEINQGGSSCKRRKVAATSNADIGDFQAGAARWYVNETPFEDAVAGVISVDKVPLNVFEGKRFRKLVSVLSGISAADLAKNGLLVNHRKIREKGIPRCYDEARKRLLIRSDDAATICGLTVADDGFKDRRKNHVSGVTISSPSPFVESITIAVISVSADSLHAFAIARGWEELVLLVERKTPVSDYPDGHFVALPQVPVAFCSDDASANRKRVVSLRFGIQELCLRLVSPTRLRSCVEI
jgi:hypothetical protein